MPRYFLPVILFLTFAVKAQDTTEVSSGYPLGIKPTPVETYDTRWKYANDTLRSFSDTLALDFHLYNPAENFYKPYTWLGNLGQAMRPLVFEAQKGAGFRSGFHTFDNYWYTQGEVKYYRTKVPFTSLGYVFGQGNENKISVVHSQNITPRINLAVDYCRLVSDGQSQRQKAGTHNMATNGWFDTKGGRYSAMAAFIFNQTKNQENGGWSVDPFTEEGYEGGRNLVPVNLEEAENKWSQRNVRLQQSFFLSRNLDSVRVATGKSIIHTIEYDNRRFEYTDNEDDSTFYFDYFIDSNSTDDRTKYWLLSNSVAWQHALIRLTYHVGVSYAAGKYFSALNDRIINDGKAFAGINGSSAKGLTYSGEGEIHFTPDFIGDLRLNAELSIPIGSRWGLRAMGDVQMSTPAYKEEFYFSNHFAWSTDLKKTFRITARAVAVFQPWNLELIAENHLINNFIYFGRDSKPAQEAAVEVVVGGAKVAKEWRHIGWKGYAWVQWASGDAVELPLFVTRQSVYYKGGFIKGLVKANLGIDIWYNTNYAADAYNPATASFYRQDRELKQYPVFDAFFDIQVKRARIFFVYRHLNEGLFKPGGYYSAPGYAMPDRAFKIGVSWQFYN